MAKFVDLEDITVASIINEAYEKFNKEENVNFATFLVKTLKDVSFVDPLEAYAKAEAEYRVGTKLFEENYTFLEDTTLEEVREKLIANAQDEIYDFLLNDDNAFDYNHLDKIVSDVIDDCRRFAE